ncbi:SIMPL domain-containing protein [uncultured Cohaesibacter sp.]|uniref:SIMPL domain-containing protein n=1 Tax=uncultured Cohaesibacter sp. TaxID=1002546 RepID=UPI002931972C|nr:SIMPL domain-containing protein [uncultured Cohaesibacter sp.]
MKFPAIAIMALLALLTLPATASELGKNTISITGSGIVKAEPDMAIVSAGVETRAKDAKAALSENNSKMAALMEALQEAGIDKKDIQTSNFNISPQLTYPKDQDRAPEIVGYAVNNQITIQIRQFDKIGNVLTSLVNSGANDISSLRFDVSDKSELLDTARKAALADARHKAELYAKELGAEIHGLRSLSESSGFDSLAAPEMKRAMSISSDVPVAGGSVDLSISVNTTWILAD